MIVFFTEIEQKYINKRSGRWTIKDSCPDDIRPKLKRKLDYLYDPKYRQSERR